MTVKILVADDSATMRKILQMTFAGEDAEVLAVPSADAALERAEEFGPHVVFADASMGPVDGYELAKSFKSRPALNQTAVIVMASQQRPFDSARGKSCGVDDHIVKPFDTQVVIDRVGQVLSKARMAPSTSVIPDRATETMTNISSTAASRPIGSPVQASVQPRAPKRTVGFGSQPPATPQIPPVVPTSMHSEASSRPMTSPGISAPPIAQPVVETATVAPHPAPSIAVSAEPATDTAQHHAGAPKSASTTAATDTRLEAKLASLNVSDEILAAVRAVSKEVIEEVVWDVVPDLAETIIREEIQRLTR